VHHYYPESVGEHRERFPQTPVLPMLESFKSQYAARHLDPT